MRQDHRNVRRALDARAVWRTAAAWRVLATLALVLGSAGAFAWGERIPIAFAQDDTSVLPGAPGLAAPADGTTVDDAWRDVELQWNAVSGASEYQVVLNDGERTGPWVTGTSWSPGSLPEGTYQWSVRARNAAGVGFSGDGFTFTIAPDELALEPLPFPLQQEAMPLDVEVIGDNATTTMSGTQVSSPGTVNGAPVTGQVQAPAAVGTPTPAGTPVPVADAAADPAAAVDGDDGANGVTATGGDGGDGGDGTGGDRGGDGGNGGDGGDGTDGADGAAGEPGQDGQDGQPGADANAVSRDGGGGNNKDNDDRAREERERKDREVRDKPERGGRTDSQGNGGVSEVVAVPPQIGYLAEWPAELTQAQLAQEDQNGTTSTSGATGESGTVNGEPRNDTNADAAPAASTGPGAPLAPGEVILPPTVPGLAALEAGSAAPAPSLDPALAAGIAGTTELAFDAIADATVFGAAPDAPQTAESTPLLGLGGPQDAASLISFEVSGVGEGTVLSALLTFTGAGETGAQGGGVGVIYDYVVPEGVTANSMPGGETALNVHGAPAWFEEVEPGGITSIDVTGSVYGDGVVTFVVQGQPEAAGAFYAMESGTVPQLVLNVALPA